MGVGYGRAAGVGARCESTASVRELVHGQDEAPDLCELRRSSAAVYITQSTTFVSFSRRQPSDVEVPVPLLLSTAGCCLDRAGDAALSLRHRRRRVVTTSGDVIDKQQHRSRYSSVRCPFREQFTTSAAEYRGRRRRHQRVIPGRLRRRSSKFERNNNEDIDGHTTQTIQYASFQLFSFYILYIG